jgi:hypothetical protein
VNFNDPRIFIKTLTLNQTGLSRKNPDPVSGQCQGQLFGPINEETGKTSGTCRALSPHTLQIFQVRDRLLFGRLKAAKKQPVRDLEESAQLDHVVRVFKADELVTTRTTNRASFQQTRFDYERPDGTWHQIVNDQRLRRCREFQEVWEIDYPEESLSQRRRGQVWRWLNKDYFPRNFLRCQVCPALDSGTKQSISTSPFRFPVSSFILWLHVSWYIENEQLSINSLSNCGLCYSNNWVLSSKVCSRPSIVMTTVCHITTFCHYVYIWLDQCPRIKWSDRNWPRFHSSDTEIYIHS